MRVFCMWGREWIKYLWPKGKNVGEPRNSKKSVLLLWTNFSVGVLYSVECSQGYVICTVQWNVSRNDSVTQGQKVKDLMHVCHILSLNWLWKQVHWFGFLSNCNGLYPPFDEQYICRTNNSFLVVNHWGLQMFITAAWLSLSYLL